MSATRATGERSYAQGAGTTPLLGATVGDVLDEAARRWPERDALIVRHQQIRWTWNDVRDRARYFGAGLLRLGLHPGDRVGIVSPNRAEWVVTQFATAYAGLVLVNINPAYRVRELEYALGKVGCRALVAATAFKTSRYVEMLRELAPELDRAEPGHLTAARLPQLRWVVQLDSDPASGCLSFTDVATPRPEALGPLDDVSMRLDFDTPINIQYTSGTTGSPKAATLTHHTIVNNASLGAATMRFSPEDRLCVPVPMYHCFGMVLGTLLCATRGAAIVFPSAGFDAGAVLEAVEAERCTALHGVPTMFLTELDHPDFPTRDLRSLRTGIMAGAPCPVELMQQVMRTMHMGEITIGYGMTETGPLSTQTAVDDEVDRRVGTVGRPLPHTEVKIVDEHGALVARGATGELCTRGYCVMRGYWDDAEKTAEVIDAAGWMHTGDLATLDGDGYVRIVGRLKDLVIRGGENIYPREIEDCLYTHPTIDQVEVFGVPDAKYGEEVAAWIRVRDGHTLSAEEVRAFCGARLAHFKVPRHIKFVTAFPMTVTGKVQKFRMRELMARELESE